MRHLTLVVLVVLLAAILSLPVLAQEGPVGSVNGFRPAPGVSTLSVSFTGTDSRDVRDTFMGIAKERGQSVSILDWGGKYQFVLNGHEDNNSVHLGVAGRIGKIRVAGNVQDWTVWELNAEVRQSNRILETLSVRAEGPRVSLNGSVSSRQGSIYLGGTNNWLGRSLRKQAADEMAQKIYGYLIEAERLEEANRPRDAEGKPILELHSYLMMSVNNDIKPMRIEVAELDEGSLIAILRGGRQVGVLKVLGFDIAQTRSRVSVHGDVKEAVKKGTTFRTM